MIFKEEEIIEWLKLWCETLRKSTTHATTQLLENVYSFKEKRKFGETYECSAKMWNWIIISLNMNELDGPKWTHFHDLFLLRKLQRMNHISITMSTFSSETEVHSKKCHIDILRHRKKTNIFLNINERIRFQSWWENILHKQISFVHKWWQGNQIYLLTLPLWKSGKIYWTKLCAIPKPVGNDCAN